MVTDAKSAVEIAAFRAAFSPRKGKEPKETPAKVEENIMTTETVVEKPEVEDVVIVESPKVEKAPKRTRKSKK